MPSRVIHIRLDDWVIVGCYDLLELGGGSTENIPAATIIRQVLNAFVRKMQTSDKIPMHTEEERFERIKEIYDIQAFNLTDIPEDTIVTEITDYNETTRSATLDVSELAEQVVAQIQESEQPTEIADDVEVADIVIEDTPITAKIDLTKQKRRPFSEIYAEAPKDRLVEWAAEEDNELAMAAVAIIYSNLPKDLWGSNKAEQQVVDLLTLHKKDDAP